MIYSMKPLTRAGAAWTQVSVAEDLVDDARVRPRQGQEARTKSDGACKKLRDDGEDGRKVTRSAVSIRLVGGQC